MPPTKPKPKPRLFISATSKDLEPYCREAERIARRLGFEPIYHPYWAATGMPPLEKCLQEVEGADLVLAIVARRYGHIPQGSERSITERECRHAWDRKIPVIPLLLAEDAAWDRRHAESYRMEEAVRQGRQPEEIGRIAQEVAANLGLLKAFRAWLETLHAAFFKDREGFITEANAALAAWRRDAGGASGSGFDPGEYRDHLIRHCGSIELLGTSREAQTARLQQVYVPAVGPAQADPDGQRRARLGGEDQASLLLRRLGEESLYLPGDPGAGKSTFCRWLALVTAEGRVPEHPVPPPEGFAEALPEGFAEHLPVLCTLRHLGRLEVEGAGGRERYLCRGDGQWTRDNLTDALAAWLDKDRPGSLDGATLLEALKQGECLLILDGVDEMPKVYREDGDTHHPRSNLLTGLADALPAWIGAGNRVLLTSRPYGLSVGERGRLELAQAELQPLPEPLQELFIRRWYAAVDPAQADDKAGGLIRHLQEREEEGIAQMRRNPMLLTALCIQFDEGRRLPKDVHELYDKVVARVLYSRYRHDSQREDRARLQLAAVALGMHTGAALDIERTVPASEADLHELDRILDRLSREEPRAMGQAGLSSDLRHDLLSESGLLLPKSAYAASFYHFSFQEFLAAERLHGTGSDLADCFSARAGTAEWRRTLTFLFSAHARHRGERVLSVCHERLLPRVAAPAVTADPNPALLLADCLEIAHARGCAIGDFEPGLMGACQAALGPGMDPKARARLWEAAGRMGFDRRPGVGLDDQGLPDIAWCQVPAGQVTLEEDAGSFAVPAFRIARYPVTQAQFQAFGDAPDGYRRSDWWETEWLERRWVHLDQPSRPRWSAPNGPMERVNWCEAVAFCSWLTARLRERGKLGPDEVVRLPSEWEWQQAASGGETDRTYPWGDKFDAMSANTRESRLLRTSAVGLYPAGASPVGALDMVGNVDEWSLNRYHEPRNLGLDGDEPRAVCGGSWIGARDYARAACRGSCSPVFRSDFLGFRLCLASPIEKR